MRLFLIATFAVLLSLFSAPALAQSDVERAQEHYDDGAAFYLEGEYGKALLQFKKALTIIDDPRFVFNIALTEHKLGNTERSRDAANKALQTGKLDTRSTTVAQALVASANRALLAPRVATAVSRIDNVADTTGGNGDGVGDTSGDGTSGGVTDTADSGGLGTLGWTGVALAAAGTGALVGSGLIGMSAQDNYDIYQDPNQPTADRQTAQSELESERPLGIGLMVGGGVLAATGIALVLIDLTSGDETTPSTTVTVSPDPNGGSVWLKGRF